MRYADLHTHTCFSDGTLAPDKLVQAAGKAGLSALAVADHDSVAGLEQAEDAGRKYGIEVIPGIEFSAEYEGKEIHILGYFLDYRHPGLLGQLEVMKQNRIRRVFRILEKLKEAGVELDAESVFRISSGGTVGRLHIARALVKEGKVRSTGEAFQRYIADHGPAFVLGFRFSPAEAISLIKQARGVPVLAHPYVIRDDGVINEVIRLGIMGIEVFYPEHTQSVTNYFAGLARKHNLVATGGSDYHGAGKPGVELNCMKVPYQVVGELKAARARI